MNEEEFEELFGNTPFENIKKIRQYIDKNYIPIQKVKDKIKILEKLQNEFLNNEELRIKIIAYKELLEGRKENG